LAAAELERTRLGSFERTEELSVAQVTFEQRTQELEETRKTRNALDTAIRNKMNDSDSLLKALNESRLLFNQGLWAQMDPATVGSMIAGGEFQGTSLTKTVDPNIVTITGNYVGFRWGFPETEKGKEQAKKFQEKYVEQHTIPAFDTYVLPTDGVFAEADRGRSNCGEKLDLTRFWKWDETTIPSCPRPLKKKRSHHRVVPNVRK